MLENTRFGKTIELLSRSMDVSMLRRDIIANNIANADVPNSKLSEINFKEAYPKEWKDKITLRPVPPIRGLIGGVNSTGNLPEWARYDVGNQYNMGWVEDYDTPRDPYQNRQTVGYTDRKSVV